MSNLPEDPALDEKDQVVPVIYQWKSIGAGWFDCSEADYNSATVQDTEKRIVVLQPPPRVSIGSIRAEVLKDVLCLCQEAKELARKTDGFTETVSIDIVLRHLRAFQTEYVHTM